MTTSITIPKRKQPLHHPHHQMHIHADPAQASSSSSASSSLSFTSPPHAQASPTLSSPSSSSPPSSSPFLANEEDQKRSRPIGVRDRRPSLLSSSLLAQEHTVINVGHPDGPPRLITCVKTSQGFDWNQEIFLPSHTGPLSPSLERKRDPVHEIVLTDEELRNVFPS